MGVGSQVYALETSPAPRRQGANVGNKKVRVGIIGVGNCASSLVQGVEYYKHAAETDAIPGLMHVNLGGYHISDIEFSAAIDIDSTKVGKDLSEAIFSGPNNTYKFASPPTAGVKVARGMTHDGLGKYLSQFVLSSGGRYSHRTATGLQCSQCAHAYSG